MNLVHTHWYRDQVQNNELLRVSRSARTAARYGDPVNMFSFVHNINIIISSHCSVRSIVKTERSQRDRWKNQYQLPVG